jgi:hypothetical protein
MNTKIATSKEFVNTWFKTGKDPDGNQLSMMLCGGNNDSYVQYVLRKQHEFKAIAESKRAFDFINAVANGRTLFIGEGNFSNLSQKKLRHYKYNLYHAYFTNNTFYDCL